MYSSITDVRKEAFKHFVTRGCMFLKQFKNEGTFIDTFYCIKHKREVSAEECIDCIEHKLIERNKYMGANNG